MSMGVSFKSSLASLWRADLAPLKQRTAESMISSPVIVHRLCITHWPLRHIPHPNPPSPTATHLTSPHTHLHSPLPPPNAVGYQCVAFNREVTLEKKGQLPPVAKVDNKVSSVCCHITGHYCASGHYNLQWFTEETLLWRSCRFCMKNAIATLDFYCMDVSST